MGTDMVYQCKMLGLMQACREQYVGMDPKGMCSIASMKLMDEIFMIGEGDSHGHGKCRLVHGSFHNVRSPCSWWPEGYQDWHYHQFIYYDDGSIADVTADQFGDFPQLWFPADKRRYNCSSDPAKKALTARLKVGQKRWDAMARQDSTVHWKARQSWDMAFDDIAAHCK